MKRKFDKENFLSAGENVIYCDKPTKNNYPIAEICVFAIATAIIVVLDGFLAGSSFVKSLIEKTGISTALIFIFSLLLHFIPLGAWLFYLNGKIYFGKNSYILVTDKKVCLISCGKTFTQTGVEYDEVTDFSVVNDKLVFLTDDGKFAVSGINDAESVAEKIREILSGKVQNEN